MSSNSIVLISTGQNNFFANENMIRLPVMEVEDAVALITTECDWLIPEKAKSLAKMLDYFPLAICQAIAYLKIVSDGSKGEVKATEILDEFSEKFKTFSHKNLHVLENDRLTAEDHHQTVYVTWMMTIERLGHKMQRIVEPLMFRLSYLASQQISHEFLLRLIDTKISVEERDFLLKNLKKYSLLEELTSDDSEDSYWSIHSLLQTVIRLHQFNLECFEQLIELMNILQSYAKDKKHACQFAPLIDHIWTAINHHEQIGSIASLR